MKNQILINGKTPKGMPIASVLILQKYLVSDNGKCSVCPKSNHLNDELIYYKNIPYSGRIRPSILKRDVDLYPWRGCTDIVIQGVARSDKAVSSLPVSIQIESLPDKYSHQIDITGNRWVEKGRTGLILSEPENFNEMPMRYDKAYGGTDELAEKKYADPERLKLNKRVVGEKEYQEMSKYSYHRNPAGKGYLIDSHDAIGLAWPNLEFPNEKLTMESLAAPLDKWGDRPYPACFDWFPHAWFPRVAFFGEFAATHDGKVPQREVKMGLLEKNLRAKPLLKRPKHGFAQGSHPFMQRRRLNGDERIRITHMSEDGRDFFAQLPNYFPEMKVRLFGGEVKMLRPVLDLVFIETEESSITLLWRGSVPTGKDFLPPDWKDQCKYKVAWSQVE